MEERDALKKCQLLIEGLIFCRRYAAVESQIASDYLEYSVYISLRNLDDRADLLISL